MTRVVLYVDDERPNLDLFRRVFADHFSVLTASSGPEALTLLAENAIGVLISDHRMTPMSGVELLEQAAARWPDVSRMLLTAYSDRDLLLAAINRGHVHDYVLKPWEEDDLSLRLQTALAAYDQRRALAAAKLERDALRDEIDERHAFQTVIGLDGGLRAVRELVERVAKSGATVMLRGESGTGKELIARAIHRLSPRCDRPFVRTCCAALSESLLESELFGHEAGAFTGASRRRIGRFEQANGGTIFLDEIGDVPVSAQVKLLRVLQERELERVGGSQTIPVDIRVIAATHHDLETLVAKGHFREDLYHRINVVPLRLPPLRDRSEDVEPLARHFVSQFAAEQGKRVALGAGAIDLLKRYEWPGNVRELRNVIERAVVLAPDTAELSSDDLLLDFDGLATDADNGCSIFEEIATDEADRIRAALREAAGSRSRAARILNVPRTTLTSRMRRLGIR